MINLRPRGPGRILKTILSIAGASTINAVCLILLAVAQNNTPENVWPLALLLFAPQQIFAVPSLLLFIYACRKKRRRLALANALAFLFCVFALLNFNLSFNKVSPQKSGVPTLRVMSYNIRYGSLGISAISAVSAR